MSSRPLYVWHRARWPIPTWAMRGARRPPGRREESAWLCSLLRCSRPLLSCRGCRYRFCEQTNEGIRLGLRHRRQERSRHSLMASPSIGRCCYYFGQSHVPQLPRLLPQPVRQSRDDPQRNRPVRRRRRLHPLLCRCRSNQQLQSIEGRQVKAQIVERIRGLTSPRPSLCPFASNIFRPNPPTWPTARKFGRETSSPVLRNAPCWTPYNCLNLRGTVDAYSQHS